MAWNPAGIARIKHYSLGGTYKNYIADVNYSFVGFAMPVSNQATLGFGSMFVGTDPIEITTINQPNGTGTYYDYNGLVLGITYSQWLTDLLTVGINIKLIRESIYRETASALAFDIGSQFDTGIYGIRLAMCLTNFGSKMRLDGPDLNTQSDTNNSLQGNRDTNSRLSTQDWPLPMMFRMGIMVDLYGGTNPTFQDEKNRFTLVLDANDPIDYSLRGNIGGEYNWNNTLSLRAGTHINYDDNTLGMTFGGGLKLKHGNYDLFFDYAYQDFGILDSVHQYTLSFYF